ncbi:MAG: ABC transporter ATP-binding protein [bacterium]
MSLIEVKNLTKEFKVFRRKEGVWGAIQNLFIRDYRPLRAVDRISFSIEEGEMVGYIGPNGAGKSTTIKMLTGILVPTDGEVIVNGFIPHRDRERYTKTIGVVFGQRTQLWWDIAVIESFKLLRKIYDVPLGEFQERLGALNDILGLKEYLNTPVRKLSLGQRMRCDLAASLLHNPKVLFLDEPTIGLDVVAKERIRYFLKEINRRYRTTIILTTHDLSDIEELCERVIIIDKGRILYDHTLAELKKRLGKGRVITFHLARSAEVEDLIRATPWRRVNWTVLNGSSFQAHFSRDDVAPGALIQRVVRDFPVVDISIEEESIENIVRKIYMNGEIHE